MAERKVVNKYYPPDFDPSKLRTFGGRPRNQQIKVRMMLPMSIRCNTCGNFIYKGTKFNSRKEVVVSETYLGMQIFRFYFKCTKCSAELAIKTDPQNLDYVVELGAIRNFEPWRKQDEVAENEKRKRAAEGMGDAMKRLENKALDTKREMDILASLDEMISMKSRCANVEVDAMLGVLKRTSAAKEKKLEEDDQALLKSIVFRTSKDFVRKIEDEDSEDEEDLTRPVKSTIKKRRLREEYFDKPTDSLTKATSLVSIVVVKKAATTYKISAKIVKAKEDQADKNSGLSSLLQNYESSDADDD
ncbi:hypothetical protein NL676_008806 [Syzygium grande]|nr:hypothetical protein NL676_008806 [Syzygium grande]